MPAVGLILLCRRSPSNNIPDAWWLSQGRPSAGGEWAAKVQSCPEDPEIDDEAVRVQLVDDELEPDNQLNEPELESEDTARKLITGQSASNDAIVGEAAFSGGVLAVHFEDLSGLVLHVDQLGHAGLHAKSHFVLGDAGIDLGIAGFPALGLVYLGDAVEHGAAHVAGDAWWIGEIEHRIAGAAKLHALVLGGEEATSPKAVVECL